MHQLDTKRVVQAHYEAIKRRDLAGILQTIAEDVIWEFPAPAIIPFSGLFEGRGAVRDFFVAVSSSVEVGEFAVERIFVENETAIVLGRERFAVKATGKEWATDWVQIHTVIDGQIARFREFTDTAAIADAYRL